MASFEKAQVAKYMAMITEKGYGHTPADVEKRVRAGIAIGHEAYRKALAVQNKPPAADANGWISVEERLPEEMQTVICYLPAFGQSHDILWLTPGKKWMSAYFVLRQLKSVTHWQPLPAAPGETLLPELKTVIYKRVDVPEENGSAPSSLIEENRKMREALEEARRCIEWQSKYTSLESWPALNDYGMGNSRAFDTDAFNYPSNALEMIDRVLEPNKQKDE